MTPSKLHKMLSFGFTEKGSSRASQQAIGVYGNGFKSGSMRLGRDALIFTKNGGCLSVGMLSQTYLENIKAQAVIVPIVPFNQQTKSLVVTEDSEASLAAILKHSIITSQEQIHTHFDSILSKKGTKILIYNIRRAKDGKPEIDFDTDESDFRLPEIQSEQLKNGGSLRDKQNTPDMHFSLRAYLSILYLKPRTQIILRGKKILAKLVSKRLIHIEHDVYKPHFSKEKVKVTFGLNLKNKDYYGIMMYHRNRLIKAYEKVGCQLKASGQRAGVGVIGIIECNFLKPAHNKQDFEYTKEYRLTLGALGLKLNDYWKEVKEKKAREREFEAVDRDEIADQEGPLWLQCEDCLKWRKVPASHYSVDPENWNCSQNPNPHYQNCSSPEEAEDGEELLTPSYQKNHKKQEHPKSRKREASLEQVFESQDPAAKHQILARSSSEPTRPTFQSTRTPDRIRTAEETSPDYTANHDTDIYDDDDDDDDDDAQTQSTVAPQKPAGRRTVIKDKTQVTPVRNETKLQDKERDTNMEPVEPEGDSTGRLSLRRKPGSLFYCVKKKQKPASENVADEMNPEKQILRINKISLEKSKRESSSRVEKTGDVVQRPLTSLTWTHSLPSTQTVMVSPLSRTETPRSRPPPPERSDLEDNVQKLAALEKEAQGLRRLLGLEITKMTQGTMTTADSSVEGTMTTADSGVEGTMTTADSSVEGTMTTADSGIEKPKARREVGCQTDVAESSTSSSSPILAPGRQESVILDQRALCGPIGQPELNIAKKKTETESKMGVSDSEACEDNRSSQENLSGIRNNVVVLLTALLPQLDLAGISLETTDVDNILQQIIEVNSLKL